MAEALPARGRFITFEGGEGVGKTTQCRSLRRLLEARGLDVLSTREPGGTPGAEQIRELLVRGEAGRWDPVCELLLLYAARRDHYRRVIKPALSAGRWVLSDRFADSSMAYQGYAGGLDPAMVAQLHAMVLGEVVPDLTILLDLPPVLGLERAGTGPGPASEDRFERFDLAFHERLRAGFHRIAASAPDRVVAIDASASEADIAAKVSETVTRRFGLDGGR